MNQAAIPQTAEIAIIVIGGILLLIGLLGGGFKGFGFDIPPIADRRIRLVASFIGLLVLVVQITRLVDRLWPLTPPNQTIAASAPTSIATSASTIAPTAIPTLIPTVTPTPAPTLASTTLPTIALPTAVPTTVAISNCPYTGSTDTQTFINLIRAEEQAVLKEDLNIITTIYAKGATLTDVELGRTWSNVIEHYQLLFEDRDFIELTHYDFHVVRNTGNKAWVKSSDRSVMILAGSNERVSFVSDPGASHFVFEKDEAGCWLIAHFSKRAYHESFP